MTHSGEAQLENEALRQRVSAPSDAILGIHGTLHRDTALGGAMESVRGLTGAGGGVIVTVDEGGAPRDFVLLGFSSPEHEHLASWPDRVRPFEHRRSLPGSPGLADLSSYVRAPGIEPARTFSSTFQGTPMRRRGIEVGDFFLGERADR